MNTRAGDPSDTARLLRDGAALRQHLLRLPADRRDPWLDQALGVATWVEDVDLPPGGVPYLPCPVDLILAAVSRCGLGSEDVFVDLGAGLGRVVMLAHLLTGATAVGIEAQRHLVDQGQRRCHALRLERVSLLHADAARVDLEGTVFFLYSPFNGPTLRQVVSTLEALAQRQPLTICTVDLELPELRGLVRVPCPEVELSLWRTPR